MLVTQTHFDRPEGVWYILSMLFCLYLFYIASTDQAKFTHILFVFFLEQENSALTNKTSFAHSEDTQL